MDSPLNLKFIFMMHLPRLFHRAHPSQHLVSTALSSHLILATASFSLIHSRFLSSYLYPFGDGARVSTKGAVRLPCFTCVSSTASSWCEHWWQYPLLMIPSIHNLFEHLIYIADYIANNYCTEQGVPYDKGRKLHYMVNAILSSPKYKYLFLKDQVLKVTSLPLLMPLLLIHSSILPFFSLSWVLFTNYMQDEKRSLWRLKCPGEFMDEDTTVPPEMAISSLIPTSPRLSLKQSRDDLEPTSSSLLLSTIPTSSSNIIKIPPPFMNPPTNDIYGGGSNEGREEKQGVPFITEHPHIVPSPPSPSPTSPYPGSPILGDGHSLPALSARRKKRKGSGMHGAERERKMRRERNEEGEQNE